MQENAGIVGAVRVFTSSGRGFTPEELAEQALLKIICVSADASPAVKEQAVAFQNKLRTVLVYYMKEAIKQDRLSQRMIGE